LADNMIVCITEQLEYATPLHTCIIQKFAVALASRKLLIKFDVFFICMEG